MKIILIIYIYIYLYIYIIKEKIGISNQDKKEINIKQKIKDKK